MRQDFYVYEHRRRDNGAVFYVGAGSGRRSTVRQNRSQEWQQTSAEGGLRIVILACGLDLELAHLVEREVIDKRRRAGHPLVNKTNGGYGSEGYAWPAEVLKRRAESQRGQKRATVSEKLRGKPKSPEHRAALAAAKLGKAASAEARKAMSDARKGKPLARAVCASCGFHGTAMNIARWHGANCKKGN